jgi:hypothetical protein
MARETTKRIALRPDTKQLLDDLKPGGVTHDHFQRELITVYQQHNSE